MKVPDFWGSIFGADGVNSGFEPSISNMPGLPSSQIIQAI